MVIAVHLEDPFILAAFDLPPILIGIVKGIILVYDTLDGLAAYFISCGKIFYLHGSSFIRLHELVVAATRN
jgi:hypothetical protein